MTANGRDGCKWPGSNYPWYIYNGIFACFLHGRCTFLLAKTSRSQQIRARVEEGWMMSSTNPGEAQERKQIICSPRCCHPSNTTCAQPGHYLLRPTVWAGPNLTQEELGPVNLPLIPGAPCSSGRSHTSGLGTLGKKRKMWPSPYQDEFNRESNWESALLFFLNHYNNSSHPVHKPLCNVTNATPPIRKWIVFLHLAL